MRIGGAGRAATTWTPRRGTSRRLASSRLILPLYFTTHAYQLTIDMGAGKWKDDAVESRPAVDYFPAFPGQQIGNYMYPSGKTVHLPIDQRYGGQVTSGIDSQGRPYSLRGYAYLDGSLCFVDLDGDASPRPPWKTTKLWRWQPSSTASITSLTSTR